MQLTRERAITLHRRMWRWIGLKTLKEKRCVKKDEWFERFKLNKVCCECYCCEYVKQFLNIPPDDQCGRCPIDWVGIDCTYGKKGDGHGLLILWSKATLRNNWRKAGKLALQIAELPEREEI